MTTASNTTAAQKSRLRNASPGEAMTIGRAPDAGELPVDRLDHDGVEDVDREELEAFEREFEDEDRLGDVLDRAGLE
jgi:hypothetical protein